MADTKQEQDLGYRCARCGGKNVQGVAWINLNTEELGEDFGSWDATDTKWCLDCDDHTEILNTDEPEQAAMIPTQTDGPCPHCGRQADGKWVSPCPSDDCPSHDEEVP